MAATACDQMTGNRSEVIFYKLMRLRLERKCRLFLDFFFKTDDFHPFLHPRSRYVLGAITSTALELGGEGGYFGTADAV